jgi:hypothetical protein
MLYAYSNSVFCIMGRDSVAGTQTGYWPRSWGSNPSTGMSTIYLSISFRLSRVYFLSLTNSTLSTADVILLRTKNLYLIHSSHFPLCRKLCVLLIVRSLRPSIWPPALPLNVTNILIVLLIPPLVNLPYTNFTCSMFRIPPAHSVAFGTGTSEPALYKLHMFHVPNPMCTFRRFWYCH